jgi:hypothetical protein
VKYVPYTLVYFKGVHLIFVKVDQLLIVSPY